MDEVATIAQRHVAVSAPIPIVSDYEIDWQFHNSQSCESEATVCACFLGSVCN